MAINRYRFTALASVLTVAVFGTHASAQSTYTWNTNASVGLWYTTNNWAGGPANTYPGASTAPGTGNAADIAQFNPTATTQVGIPFNLGASLQLGAINFQSNTSLAIGNSSTTNGAMRLNGATLGTVANTLVAIGNTGADLTITNNPSGQSGTMGLILGTTNGVFNIYGDDTPVSGVRTLTVGSVISEAAANSGFTVQGGGNVTLTAANTFTGVVTVGTATSDGRLTITNGSALGTTAGKTVINSGGTLFLNNAGTVNENIDFTGTGFVADTLLFGAIRVSNNNTTLGGTLTLTGNSQMFITGSTTTLTGTLTESGGSRQFDLLGVGTLQTNTPVLYSGATTVQGATFNLTATSTLLNTSSITVSLGGTLRLSNTSGTGNLGNRIADAIPINLVNGTLNFTNTAVAATNYAESLGVLSAQSYLNTVSTAQAAAGQTSTLTFASLNRVNGGSVNFTGTGLGVDTRNVVLFTSAPTVVNGMIAPWTLYNATPGDVGNATGPVQPNNPTGDFASYSPTLGIVPMTNVITDQSGIGWTGTSNIKLTLNNGAFPQSGNIPAINSLTILTTSSTPGTTYTNFLFLNDGNTTNNLTINSGGVLISGPHNLTVSAGTNVTSGTNELVFNILNGTTTFLPAINDNGGPVGLTKVGNGVLLLGNNNNFSGPIVVDAGTNSGGLQINGLGALGSLGGARTITLKAAPGGGNGSTLNFNFGGTSSTGLTLPNNFTIFMEGFLSGGAVNNLTAQGITGVNSRSSIITNGNLTINGPINFTGNNFVQLQQNDTSLATTLTLNGTLGSTVPASPFTGWVLFRGGGNIVVNSLINLPNATIGTTEASTVVTINAPVAGTNNFLGLGITFGTVKLGTGTNIMPATGTVFLGQNGNANTGAFWLNGNNQTIAQLGIQVGSTGTLVNNIVQNGAAGASTLTFAGNTFPSRFDGTVQDGGAGVLNLTLTGGSLTLTGPNTYTGVTTVNAGSTLGLFSVSNAGSPGALGSAGVAPTNFSINGGTIQYIGGPSSTDRGFTVGASGATFNVSTLGGNVGFGGVATGAGSIIKTGPGTLILGGANTYLGSTTVNGGTLRVNNTTGSGTGPGGAVTLNNVGSTLMGTGTIGGPITINPNTVLSPGNNTVGTLSQGAFLSTWGPAGVYTVEYDGTAGTLTSGSNVDFFNSLGTLSVTADATNKFVINIRRVAGNAPQTANTVNIASFASPPTINPNFFTFTGQFFNGVTPSIQAVGNNVQITFAPLAPPPAQLNWQATASANWSDPTNWDGPVGTPQNSVPQPGTVATFSLATATQFNTNNDIVGLSVDGIRVSGTAPAAFSIGGNPFTIGTATGIDMSAAAANLTISAAITLGVSQTWNVGTGRNLLMTGGMDGAATLTKAGAGTLQLNNASNSYSGGTVVTGGVLEVLQTTSANLVIPTSGLSQIGTGSITINGGELRLTAPGTNNVGTTAGNATPATLRGVTFGVNAGILSMNKVVDAVIPITTNNAATGTAIIKTTTANNNNWVQTDSFLLNSGNLTGTGPLLLDFSGGATAMFNNAQTVPMVFTFRGADNGSLALNRSGVQVNGAIGNTTLGRLGTTNVTITFTNGLHFQNAVSFTELNGSAIIDGDITFDTMPNGTFVDIAARTTGTAGAYSPMTLGGTTVNARTITIQNNATMILDSRSRVDNQNVGGMIVNAKTVIQPGGTLEFNQNFTTSTGENATGFHLINGSITGTGSDVADARMNLQLGNKTANGGAVGGVNWNSTVTTPTPAALIVNGTGNGGLRVEGPTANITNGGFYVAARINSITGTGGALTFAPSDSGLTLNLAPSAASTVKLGVASSGAGAVTVNVGAAANDLANWGGLVVKGSSGAGSTVANLAANQTFASTTVIGGTLSVGSGITLTSPTTVSTAGTLGGTGTVAGAVTVNAGGTVAPGNSPGILTATGNVTFAAGSTFKVDLNGNTPGNGAANHDQLVLNGTGVNLNLGNATFSGTLGYSPANTDKLYIISLTNPTSTVTGTFNNVPQNGSVTIGGFAAQVSYVGDTGGALTGGNDVVLFNFTPVPEPATVLGLGALGLAGAGWLRRRYAKA